MYYVEVLETTISFRFMCPRYLSASLNRMANTRNSNLYVVIHPRVFYEKREKRSIAALITNIRIPQVNSKVENISNGIMGVRRAVWAVMVARGATRLPGQSKTCQIPWKSLYCPYKTGDGGIRSNSAVGVWECLVVFLFALYSGVILHNASPGQGVRPNWSETFFST